MNHHHRSHPAFLFKGGQGRTPVDLLSVRVEVGGESNAQGLAFQHFQDYEAILLIVSDDSKSDLKRLSKNGEVFYEGTE